MPVSGNQLHPRLEECKAITKRVVDEVRSATRIWAIVEAFYGRDEEHRHKLHRSIELLGLGSTAATLLKALHRDTLSGLLRISDPPGNRNRRQTLCRLSELLEEKALLIDLGECAKQWDTDEFSEWSQQNAELAMQNISFIKSLVPTDWISTAPLDARLQTFRISFRDLRNSILAHAQNYEEVKHPTFGQTRDFLKLLGELQAACSLVFLGSSTDLQERWDGYLREANEFWDLLNPSDVSASK
jgi:hypothetical protein